MKFFPLMLNFSQKSVLIIGGGEIAANKVDKLLLSDAKISVVSPSTSAKLKYLIENNNITYLDREFIYDDILDKFAVICCANSLELQESIYYMCKKNNILYSCVDLIHYCDFIFTSTINRGDLSISISTNGTSPSFAKEFKTKLNAILPNNLENYLEELKDLRNSMPKGKTRREIIKQKTKELVKEMFNGF